MKCKITLVAVVLVLSAHMASADTIGIVRGSSSWNPFETPSTGGSAFWNNWSLDSHHQCNIGYWLAGAGDFAPTGGSLSATGLGETPSYLGDVTTGFNLTRATGTQLVTVTLLLQLTAYRNLDEFGWFDTSDPSALNPLFHGVTNIGGQATFAPSDSYGFYLRSPEGTYLSTGAGDSLTHFALFQPSGDDHFLMGVEDMWHWSDRDFNDFVVDVQVSSVPEPASMVLLGTGLLGLAAAVRRRRIR